MVNAEEAREVKVMMVVVEPEVGLGVGVEVEDYQVILWMKHSMLTFRCMLTVCSAQHTFFFFLSSLLFIQLNLKLNHTAVEEEEVVHQFQILNRILQTVLQVGDEVVEASVVEVEVEDFLKRQIGVDTVKLGLELLQMLVVVVVAVEGLKDYDRMPL